MPARFWRGGPIARGLLLSFGGGLFFGAVAWLDSGMWLAGAVVFVVLGVASGVWMSRSVNRYWSGASELSGLQREAVVAATRNGRRVADDLLAPAVVDYRDGLHAAAIKRRPLRWVIVLILVVAVASAVWDGVYGSLGNTVVSGVYLVLIALELFWWPRRQVALLDNADHAADLAREVGTAG